MLQKAFKVVIDDFIKAGVNPNEAIKFAFSLMTLPTLSVLIMLLVVLQGIWVNLTVLLDIDDKIEYWKCLLNKDYAYEVCKEQSKYRDILGGISKLIYKTI